jgi:PAS domain S-box-containing protein
LTLLNFITKYFLSTASAINDEAEKRRIVTAKFLALISSLFCVSYTLIYYYYGFNALVYVNIVAIFIYLFVFYYLTVSPVYAKAILFFSLVVNLFIASSFFGRQAQIHLLLLPVSLIPFILIDVNKRLTITLFLCISFSALALLYITNFSLFIQENLSANFIYTLDAANKIFSTLGAALILFMFVYSGEKVKHTYREENKKLHTQLQSVFDNAFDAIFLIDVETKKIIRANNKATLLFEVKSEEAFLSLTQKHLFNNCFSISDMISIDQKLKNDNFWEAEAEFISVNGKHFWGAISIKLIEIEAKKVQLIRITDISSRKQMEMKLRESEEKYSGIFKNTPDGVFLISIKDGEFFIEDTNPVHEEFTSKYFGPFKGRFVKDVLPPEIAAFPLQQYAKCYQTGKVLAYEEHTELDGVRFFFYIVLSPIKNEKGEIFRLLGTARDITSFKLAEEKLIQALKEKEILLSEIHHRVKNNLAVVSGLLMLQAEKVKHPEDFSLFEESRNRIHSMALIHEKLYKNEDFSSIDFSQYLRELTENIKSTYALKNKVSLELSLAEVALEIKLALPLGLVLNEVITNSFKHAFNNNTNPVLTLGLEKNENLVCVSVHDNGPGFNYENAMHNNTTLGMTLVSALIEQIEGTFDVVTNNGTMYIIKFRL